MNFHYLLSTLFVSVTIVLSGCAGSSDSRDVSMNAKEKPSSLTFMSFYARATTDSISAGYGMIMNKSDKDITLTSTKIIYGAKGMAEIHQTTIKDGIASMKKIDSLKIPINSSAVLQPGGLHIMLMNLESPLVKDATLGLMFIDSNNQEYQVAVKIETIAMSMDHSKH
jgi:copper(I)-binding protein